MVLIVSEIAASLPGWFWSFDGRFPAESVVVGKVIASEVKIIKVTTHRNRKNLSYHRVICFGGCLCKRMVP